MSTGYEQLFLAIRQASSPEAWSSGIRLARQGKVLKEDDGESISSFRVLSGARGRSHEVDLFLEDNDWQCACSTGNGACEHVCAAMITLRSAAKEEKEVPKTSTSIARLGYRLGTLDGWLYFDRVAILDGKEVPYTKHLGSKSNKQQLMLADGDLELDRIMGTWRRGKVPLLDVERLMWALSKATGRVAFQGRPVEVKRRPITPVLRIDDVGRGFFCQLVKDERVDVWMRGAALIGEVLYPVDDEAGIMQRERRLLERGQGFGDEELNDLMHLIQRLEKLVPIDRRTERLPSGTPEPPRLVIDTSIEDDQLVVLASLVYGDPPIARVDGMKLTMLEEKMPVPWRDEEEERILARRLFRMLGLEVGRKAYFDGMEAIEFSAKLKSYEGSPQEAAISLEGDGHEDFAIVAGELRPQFRFTEDGFSLEFLSEDGEAANPQRAMQAWARNSLLAPMEGGGYAPLPVEWLEEYGATILGLLTAKGDNEEPPLSAAADVLKLADELGIPAPPKFEKLRVLLDDFEALPEATLPEDLNAELRPYQEKGAAWLEFHREAQLGALLADDMGLGKTLQALTAIRGRTLVVAPTSVAENWVREAERFRPNLEVSFYYSPQRELRPEVDVTVTTWAILRLDVDLLAEQAWDTVVLDEAQTIKNPQSLVAQAAHRLHAPFRLALTGTPVENRLTDLWSQMQFVEPGLLGSQRDFEERYGIPIAAGDEVAAKDLRRRISPLLLRRRKSEVALDLPPRTELLERCELSTSERQVYDALRAAAQKEVVEALSGGATVFQALELLLRLRQAACHTGLVPGQQAFGTSSKVDLLLDRLDSLIAENHKILVFSQWTSFLDLIEPALKRAKWDFLRIDGSSRNRQDTVDRFQDPNGPPIMLLSLKAGGTGLTLTAADHVVLMDPWWNPAVEDQAADRAHRIGQDKPVFIHRLVAADTVEEKIIALQEKKRRLASAALEHGAGSSALTAADLLALLS